MTAPDFQLDRRAIRRHAERAATHYDKAAVLAREVARRMDEQLDYIKLQPTRILDLGCGTGADFGPLTARYPRAQHIGIDLSPAMLRQVSRPTFLQQRLQRLLGNPPARLRLIAADAEQLPLAHGSVQMIWSNLLFNWLHDPLPAFKEAHRVLAVDGLLMFSTLGPDTLRELRACLPCAAGERVHRFIDMHDLGDALVQAGFSEPVMSMQHIQVTYEQLDGLLRDLRELGATNAAFNRPRGLTGRRGWQQARTAYEGLRTAGPAGRLPATFEIVFGHAWKAPLKKLDDGRAIIQFRPRA